MYKTSKPITLYYGREDSSYNLITGLSVAVEVYDAKTGTQLLSSTSLVEVMTGLYAYSWSHGLTSTTECVAIYTESGVQYRETFIVDAELSNLDAPVSSRESETNAASRYNDVVSNVDSEGGEIA